MKALSSQRSWLSPLVAAAFIIISITGVLLFYHVKGNAIRSLHEWFGWVFIGAGLLHILLNLRPMLQHVQKRSGIAALVLAVMLTVGLVVFAPAGHGKGPRREGPPSAGQTLPPQAP
jgi:hypothetical protein